MTQDNEATERINPYEFRGTLESSNIVTLSGINTALIILLSVIVAIQFMPACKMPSFFSGVQQNKNCPIFLFNFAMPLGMLAALDTLTNNGNAEVIPQVLFCGAYFLTLTMFCGYLFVWFFRKTIPPMVNLIMLILGNAGWYFVIDASSSEWQYGIYLQTTLLSSFAVLSYYRLNLMKRSCS
jgi:hypothetical protein